MNWMRKQFETPDTLRAMVEGDKAALRNMLWNTHVHSRYKQGNQTDIARYRAYLLQRMHNRWSRLLPYLVTFVRNVSGTA
jgi:hypothetical protein